MNTVNTPMKIPELDLKPEPTGGIQLSENMQQSLSLLTAFWRNKRVLLKASPSGVLSVSSARIDDIKHYTGVGANDTQTGNDVKCTEVMVMGHPDNTDMVWVRPDKTATVDNAWPLAKGEVTNFTLDNLKQLNMLFVVAGEKCIVAYTR